MSQPVHVLITLPFSPAAIKQLSEISSRLVIEGVIAHKAEEVPMDVWERVEVLYTNRVLPAAEQVPHLQWIQFHWAGVDHALEAPILQRPGLVATSLSGASVSQMAEHVVMMLLAMGHHLPEAFHLQADGVWPPNRSEIFNPLELRGSTVGIVGYGSIGRQVARILHVLGARVLATKRDAMHPEDTGYVPDGFGDPVGELVHRLYPPQALRSMLKECDFVVVAVPKTPETIGMLGTEELAQLKPGACLVDVSRGGILDQSALIPLLKERKIAKAALDVFPSEPLPADSPLWKMSNVIITPHISGFSSHYDERAVEMFAKNLERYLTGLPLYNRLTIEKGY